MQFGYPEAILLAQPGGLITPGEKNYRPHYDLTDADIELRIVSEDRNLLNLFEESASFEMIAETIYDLLCLYSGDFM